MERGQGALEAGNLDLAADMLLKALSFEPNNLVARRLLYSAAIKKVEKPETAILLKVSQTLVGAWASFLSLVTLRRQAIVACDKHLSRHPHSLSVRLVLAGVAEKTGYLQSAILEYEQAQKLNPNHEKLLRHLGRAYRDAGEVHKALACFERLRNLRPDDLEATRESQALAARGAILQAGWAEAETYREVIKDEEEALRLEEEQRIVRTVDDLDRAIQRIQEQIEKEPEETRHYLRLGDLQKQKGELDQANQAYQRALALDRTNFTIQARIGDLKLQKMQARVKELEVKAKDAPEDTELATQLEQLRKEFTDARLEEYRRRVRARPTDTGLKFVLGRLLFEGGELDGAIAEFQQAVQDPHYQVRALDYLGRCFAGKEMYDMAESQFKRAQQLCDTFSTQAKQITYNLGQTYERMGDLEKAEAEYRKIYERDIGFRDVAQKVESLYKRRREESAGS